MREKMDEVADRILKESDFTEQQVRDIIENRHGWAVAEQFDDILKGESLEEQNSNALEIILEVLESLNDPDWEYMIEDIQGYFGGY